MCGFSNTPDDPCNTKRSVGEEYDDGTNEDGKKGNKSGVKEEELRSNNNVIDDDDILSLVAVSCSIQCSNKDDIA